jgi:hypothetical protein
MKRARIRIAVLMSLVGLGLPVFPAAGLAQWSVETVRANGRESVRARLPEFGGRATLLIQCSPHGADPLVYLHQPLGDPAVNLAYRFDDDDAVTRRVPLSQSGHVLQIWTEDEKQKFSSARRLRIQLRPFMIFDFDLRGIETIAAKLQCR